MLARGRARPAEDGDQLFRRGAVGGVGGEVQVCDAAVAVEDDVGPELQRVVSSRHAAALSGENRAEARACDPGTQHPEWRRPAGPERLVQRPLRVGDDESIPESELVTPGGGSGGALRCHDGQSRACGLDLGKGLRNTAEVEAADVSARVPREIHDGRVPEEVAVGHDPPVGVLELEGGE